MARSIQTHIPRPHLATVQAVRVDWPVPDSPHLPAPGTRGRSLVARFVAQGARRDISTEHEVRVAYEILDAEGRSLGLTWQAVLTGVAAPGEWRTYRQGRYIGTDRLPYRYPRSLKEAARELARRELRSLQDAGRRRRLRETDAEVLASLTPGVD